MKSWKIAFLTMMSVTVAYADESSVHTLTGSVASELASLIRPEQAGQPVLFQAICVQDENSELSCQLEAVAEDAEGKDPGKGGEKQVCYPPIDKSPGKGGGDKGEGDEKGSGGNKGGEENGEKRDADEGSEKSRAGGNKGGEESGDSEKPAGEENPPLEK